MINCLECGKRMMEYSVISSIGRCYKCKCGYRVNTNNNGEYDSYRRSTSRAWDWTNRFYFKGCLIVLRDEV